MSQSVTPCGCEFIDGNAIAMIRQHAQVDLPDNAGSMIMIEVDGSDSALVEDVEIMKKAAQHPGLLDLAVAQTQAEADHLWAIRKSLSQALRSLSPHKINEDVVVPISHLPDLLEYTQLLSKQFSIPIVNFGHGGNGNIHVNLLVDPFDPIQGPRAKECLNLLFNKVIELKGCLSGEHGIGIEKRDYLDKEIPSATLQLMQKIKKQCDPKGILNPGKLFPLSS
jgi:D-lactate dehydrogenase